MVTDLEITDKLEQITVSVQKEEEKYFEIVLLDIEEFANTNVTKCITRNLYDKEREDYICISYRWGEVIEWITYATDYRAHIKSFNKEDLWLLCKSILKEPDLKKIKYLWVDAICIDQINMEKRKVTIKHMNKIYEFCSYILAVPDLHYSYLSGIPGNNNSIIAISNYGRHIYYELLNGSNKEEEEEGKDGNGDDCLRIWEKDLNCQLVVTWILIYLHPDLHLTHFNPTTFLNQLIEFRESPEYESVLSHSDEVNEFYEFLKTSLEYLIQREKEDKEGSLQYREHYLISNLKNTPQYNILSNLSAYYDDMGQEYNTELPNIKYVFFKVFLLYNAYYDQIYNAIEFLDYVVNDWATRVWVVSEYFIAKKNSEKRPMKLAFISLLKNLCWRNEPPRSMKEEGNIYHRFFNIFDVTLDEEKKKAMERKDTLIDRVEKKLVDRSMLHIILNSNATNQKDRFYAIMNLWDKYKHVINDKNAIFSWNIRDIVDVRLQLYSIMDTEDSLQLLHACSISNGIYIPSFAIAHEKPWLDIENLHYGNFDAIENLDCIPKLELTFYQNKTKIDNDNDNDNDIDLLEQVKSEFNFEDVDKEIFVSNITSVQYSNIDDHQQLTLQCDIYYEVEVIHFINGPMNLEQQSKGELVIVPFYRFEPFEKNQTNTPSNCYLCVHKKNKVDDTTWKLKKGNEYLITGNDGRLYKFGSFDIKRDGMKLNGTFIIE